MAQIILNLPDEDVEHECCDYHDEMCPKKERKRWGRKQSRKNCVIIHTALQYKMYRYTCTCSASFMLWKCCSTKTHHSKSKLKYAKTCVQDRVITQLVQCFTYKLHNQPDCCNAVNKPFKKLIKFFILKAVYSRKNSEHWKKAVSGKQKNDELSRRRIASFPRLEPTSITKLFSHEKRRK